MVSVAKDILIDQGESAVTVQAMETFEYHLYRFVGFQDRQDVMQALFSFVGRDQHKTRSGCLKRLCRNHGRAVLNVFALMVRWNMTRFDAAIRGWAIQSPR